MRRLTGRWRVSVILLLVITAAILGSLNIAELSPRPPYISDVWFHTNNAHEFRDHAVTQDPRLAGEPFNYHMFGYAPYAAASLATGAPVANLLMRYGGLSTVWLLSLLMFNVGRAVARGSVLAGLVSALLVVAPIDVLALFSINLSPSAALTYFGVYVSSTSLGGHVYLAALLLPMFWYFRGQDLANSWVIPLFAAAGAGSKGMLGPLIVCAIFGTYLLEVIRSRRFNTRTLPLLVIVTVPTLLITAQLIFGPGSYAESVRWSYGDFGGYTKFYEALSTYFGDLWTRTLWLFGFSGLFIVGASAATWFERRKPDSSQYFTFIWLIFLASVVPAMGIALTGASQLFFLYYGLTALATLAGYGLVSLLRRILSSGTIRVTAAVATLTLVLLAQFLFVPPNIPLNERLLPIVAVFSRTYNWLPYVFASDATLPPAAPFTEESGVYFSVINMTDDLREGLSWARVDLPQDTVFVVNVPQASAYSALSEHRAFYETEMFSVYAHISQGHSDHFQWRRDLLADWQAGEADVLQRMREAGITHVYVDSVNGFDVPNTEPLYPVFENGQFAIYALSSSDTL